VSQYPVVRRDVTRTISNVLEDGGSIRMPDSGTKLISWQLEYSELSTDEWNAIDQLFAATQGSLGIFTFLDPTGNLLSWSEDYSKAVWNAGPLLQFGSGIEDPLGGNSALRLTNTAQASQRLLQTISGPAWFQYCFSIYLRTATPQTVVLLQSAAGGQASRACATGSKWSRFVLSGSLGTTEESISFGIELPAGAQVDIYGMQVEAQPGAGKYKRTLDISGVHANCRFDVDSLTVSTEGPGRHSIIVRLVSNLAAA
jgi:hypothetical protein